MTTCACFSGRSRALRNAASSFASPVRRVLSPVGGLDGVDHDDVRTFIQRNGDGEADDDVCDYLAGPSVDSGGRPAGPVQARRPC
jgi:hypothetical protein